MKVTYQTCCGVDVHKSFLVATIVKTTGGIEPSYQKKRFSTFNNPFRIFGIIFVAFNSLYPFGIGNDNIDLIFQKIKDRNPVFTCGFHTDIMTVIVKKPLLEFEN